MKKVIFIPKEDVVNIQDITNESYVGIQWKDNSKKIWIVETRDGFTGLSIGKEDLLSSWVKPSKKEYCNEANRMGSYIYVFKSQKELINWLIL